MVLKIKSCDPLLTTRQWCLELLLTLEKKENNLFIV